MKRRIGMVVASVVLASAAHGRGSESDSHSRGLELLHGALRHAGAPGGKPGALTLSWRQLEHREGAAPGAPERWPAEVIWTRDPATGEQAWTIERPSPRPLRARLILGPARALLVRGGSDAAPRPFSKGRIVRHSDLGVTPFILLAAARDTGRFGLPALLEALENEATLRYAGAQSVRGRACDLVRHSRPGPPATRWDDAPNQSVVLALDAESGRLLRRVRSAWHPHHGAHEIVTDYLDHQRVEGLELPGRVEERFGPDLHWSADLDIGRTRRSADSTLLEPPGELGPPIAPVLETTPAPELRELAQGVAMIRDAAPLYNVLLVALDAETLLIETPQDPATSRRALALAREWRPDRPVGHAVVTHFHSDHMGGLAGVVEAGIPAVVPAGSAGFYASVAALPLRSTETIAAPVPPAARIDSSTRHFGAAGLSVELLDVGPTPHASEMLVAWVPHARVLFVSDLLTTFGGEIGPGGEDTRLFAEDIRRRGLDVALFVPAHGDPIEAARLWSWLDAASGG